MSDAFAAARSIAAVKTMAFVRAGEYLNRTFVLPLLIFYATSRCNSRCASCDWWRSTGVDDLSLDELAGVAAVLPDLGTQVVVFSGGEPLLRPEVFKAADLFIARGLRLHLLTSGILLERCAEAVAARFERVTVSLDASTNELYRTVRGVAALPTIEAGIGKLKRLAPETPITARATLHRLNFEELPRLIAHAHRLGLAGISFLPADLRSGAFGRDSGGTPPALALSAEEIARFERVVDDAVDTYRTDFESGFIAESPEKIRRLVQYYKALDRGAPFPPVACNAPWISAVLEADGGVRPCFFHRPIGNIRLQPLADIVSTNLPAFRHTLDVQSNPVCAHCACSMNAGWRGAPWR